MNKITLSITALLGAMVVAQAQSTNFTPSNINVRLGYIYPLESRTRDLVDSMFSFGVDFRNSYSLIKGSKGFFSLDYYAKNLNGESGKAIPLIWNQRFELSNVEGFGAYGYVGLGGVILDLNRSKTVIGYRAGLGVDFSESVFGEVTYLRTGNQAGLNLNSVGFFIGYKF